MRKLLFLLLMSVGAVGGWFYNNAGNPYKLDYSKAVINLPVTFSAYLENKEFALGEKYLGEDLASELNRQGLKTRLYALEDTHSNRNYGEGFEIYMRYFPELILNKYHDFIDDDRIAVLFETTPYGDFEIKNADIVFVGSQRKAEEYREKGVNAHFMPQFTKTDKFYHAPKEELKRKVLFVANQWPNEGFPLRKSVDYAIRSGIKIDVYGDYWSKVLKGPYASWWKGRQITSEELKHYYSSADIVLNDTRPDMIKAGYVSNRIFDATACKAFVVSEYMPEIEEIYGDAIPMYKNEKEFKELLTYYLEHPEKRREKAEKAYKITVENFASDIIVGKMLKIMEEYRREKGYGEK